MRQGDRSPGVGMRAHLGVGLVIGPRQQHSAGPDKAAEVAHVVVRGPVLVHPLRSSTACLWHYVLVSQGLRLLQKCLRHHINRQWPHVKW